MSLSIVDVMQSSFHASDCQIGSELDPLNRPFDSASLMDVTTPILAMLSETEGSAQHEINSPTPALNISTHNPLVFDLQSHNINSIGIGVAPNQMEWQEAPSSTLQTFLTPNSYEGAKTTTLDGIYIDPSIGQIQPFASTGSILPQASSPAVPVPVNTCSACAFAHSKCDGARPCARCIRIGCACADRERRGNFRARRKKEREAQQLHQESRIIPVPCNSYRPAVQSTSLVNSKAVQQSVNNLAKKLLLPSPSAFPTPPLSSGCASSSHKSHDRNSLSASQHVFIPGSTPKLPPSMISELRLMIARSIEMIHAGIVSAGMVEISLTALSEILSQEDLVAVCHQLPVRVFLSVESPFAFEGQRIPSALQRARCFTTAHASPDRNAKKSNDNKQQHSFDELSRKAASEALQRIYSIGLPNKSCETASALFLASDSSTNLSPFLLQPFPLYMNLESSPSWPQLQPDGRWTCAPARDEFYPEDADQVATLLYEFDDLPVEDDRNAQSDCKENGKRSYSSSSMRERIRSELRRKKRRYKAKIMERVLDAVTSGNTASLSRNGASKKHDKQNPSQLRSIVLALFHSSDSDSSDSADSADEYEEESNDSCNQSSETHSTSRKRHRSPSISRQPRETSQSKGFCSCGVLYPHRCTLGAVRQVHQLNCHVAVSKHHTIAKAAATAVAGNSPNVSDEEKSQSQQSSASSSSRCGQCFGPCMRNHTVQQLQTSVSCQCPFMVDCPSRLRVNAAWERMFGISESKLMERACLDGMPQLMAQIFPSFSPEYFRLIIEPHNSIQTRIQVRDVNGRCMDVVTTSRCRINERGQICGFVEQYREL